MVAVIILLVLLILGELFTLMLQCRRGHSAWGLLRLFRYAHRGYHDKPRVPENSMAAFRRAIENGYGAELDVHLMRDGHLAVIHDASLKRTAGADVLLLDEPTAALDPLAENDIYQKYKDMTAGKTSLFISHRLASTRFCDRIIFVADGHITEEGTHDQLLARGGAYAKLFEVQSRYYQEGKAF